MSSENNEEDKSQLKEKAAESELAAEQLNDVVGGANDYYLNVVSPGNKSKTIEVNSFETGASNPMTKTNG